MSEEQKPDDQHPETVKGDPIRFPDAHPGAPRDPALIGGGLTGILGAIGANTEPQTVADARDELTDLIGTKVRGSEPVSDEALAQAREKLNRAIKESTNRRPPVD